MLQSTEEVLDQVARLIEVLVVVTLRFATTFGRNHCGFPGRGKRLDYAVAGIKGLIGDDDIGFESRQKGISALQIMSLTRRQMKARRVAERVNRGVDFGAQSASRAPDRLVFAVFF